MTRFYSKSTLGFYSDALHPVLPPDAVEISDEEHADLMAAQSQGKCIQAGADGKPVAADLPAPPIGRQRAALSRVVQAHLDATAKAAGYDSIVAAVSYADEPAVKSYQEEGMAFRAWRSKVWAAASPAIAADTLPAAAALLASLPAYVPPAA